MAFGHSFVIHGVAITYWGALWRGLPLITLAVRRTTNHPARDHQPPVGLAPQGLKIFFCIQIKQLPHGHNKSVLLMPPIGKEA